MTAAASRALSAAAVLVICLGGALLAWVLAPSAPARSGQVAGQVDERILQGVRIDAVNAQYTVDAIERQLPPGSTAIVSTFGVPATTVQANPPATSAPGPTSASPRPTGEPGARSPAPAQTVVSTQRRVQYIEDDAQLATALVALSQGNDVVSVRGPDGMWLAVGTPPQPVPPGKPWLAPAILAGAGFVAALAVLLLGGPDQPAGGAMAPQAAPDGGPSASSLLARRSTVLRGLADLAARLPDESAWQAARLLEAAGARPIAPEPGTPFDPARHHVLHVTSTPSADRSDTVAYTLRPGWHDHEQDQVLVPAHVVLYAAPDHAAPDHTAPDHTAPDHTAPDHTAPDHTAPDHTPPYRTDRELHDDRQ